MSQHQKKQQHPPRKSDPWWFPKGWFSIEARARLTERKK